MEGEVQYYLIGADGKTYGPVGEEALRQWVSEGRVIAEERPALVHHPVEEPQRPAFVAAGKLLREFAPPVVGYFRIRKTARNRIPNIFHAPHVNRLRAVLVCRHRDPDSQPS